MESIVEVIANYADETPEALCIADEGGAWSYGRVWQNVCRLADVLRSRGVKRGDRVIVECTQDAMFLACNFACELLCAIFVPVEYRVSEERLREIMEDTGAKLFCHETEYGVPLDKVSFRWLKEELQKMRVCERKAEFPAGEDTAEILYTTGTTGKSKGIEVTHSNNIALAENIKYGTEMRAGNVELIPLPLSHSHGLRCCYANFLNGSAVVLTDGVLKAKRVFELMEKYHATAMDLSPSAVMILSKLSKGRLVELAGQIDYIQVGTAVLKEDAKQILISAFPDARLYNFYGSTESGRTCALDFNKEKNRPGCIGKPTRNARFIVTDDQRNEIRSSRENMGLLASAGRMNMRGYWKQPELTRQIMQNGYVYSNDMGYIDEEGYVYVLGRQDDIINYKGIKISPDEIEEKVLKHPGIADCACVPKEDELCGQVPKLFVVIKGGRDFNKAEFVQFLRKHIDENQMPREIKVIDEIPRTYNGKIQRVKLLDK